MVKHKILSKPEDGMLPLENHGSNHGWSELGPGRYGQWSSLKSVHFQRIRMRMSCLKVSLRHKTLNKKAWHGGSHLSSQLLRKYK
jgi:hypothetical protein